MTTKKSTKRALLMSVVSLLLCCSMLVGTTFAWFTDSVTSMNNVITAGNLDVELYHSNKAVKNQKVTSSIELFDDVTLWEPGAVAYENLQVKNEGNLALKYQMALNFAKATKNDDGRTLADVLKVAVVKGGFTGDRADAQALWSNDDVEKYALSSFALEGKLEKGQESDVFGVVIYWEPTDNDNDFNMNNENQGEVMSIELGVNLFATQVEYEEDSFDETYDKDLEMPEVKAEAPTADAFLAALAAGKTAVLTGDLTLNGEDGEIPAGVTSAIDLNDYTLTLGEAGGIAVNGNLILTGNGTVVVTDEESGSAYVGFAVAQGATMEIQEGTTIDVKAGSIGIALDGNLNLAGGTINADGHGIFMMQADGAEVNLESGKVTGNGDGIYMCLSEADVYAAEGVMNAKITVLSSSTLNLTYAGDTQPTVEQDTTANVVNIRKGTAFEGITQNPDNAKQYYIESKAGLMNLNALAAAVKPSEANIITVELDTDVDLAGENWEPINSMWITFNGNNHTISNLTAGMSADGRRSGFWGYAGAVTINDLTLENVTVSGSQAGTFVGSAEGTKINNCYLKGTNTVNFVAGVETWNGIGAISGVLTNSNINVTIVEGATVTVNKGTMTTADGCTYVDDLTGYIQANNGTVTNNGIVKTSVVTAEIDTVDDILQAGGTVVLTENLKFNASETTANSGYGATGVSVKGGTLDGNGNSLGINNWGTWDAAVHTTGGTIKNLTVNSGMRGIFMGSATADVYIDNVVIDGTIYTFNSDGGSKDYGVYISNSTLNGWTSHSDVHKEVVYTNCNFGEGQGYAFCRPYGPTTFENCVFEEGFEFDTSKTSAITFENCYYGDTLITAENAATLASGDVVFFYNGLNGITIGEEKVVESAEELADALESGEAVVLTGDMTATAPVQVNGGTLNGNGNTLDFTGVKTSSWPNAYAVTLNNGGSTVENLTITHAGYALGSTAATEDIYIKNVTTDYCTYALNGNGNNTNSVYVTDSNINGWISYSNIKLLSFEGCTLGKGNTNYAYLVVYGDTTFTDCTFKSPFSMCARYQDGGVVAAGKTVTFTNCTYVQADGTSVKVTAENFASLFGRSDDEDFAYMEQVNVFIDGVAVSWN